MRQRATSKAECEAISDSQNPLELIRVAHAHWSNIGWPEDAGPVALLERAMSLLEAAALVAEMRAPPNSETCCMRCGKKLVEDRGVCADCELLLLDDVIRLKAVLEVALRDERAMRETLTAAQARCTELAEEIRYIRACYKQVLGMGAER